MFWYSSIHSDLEQELLGLFSNLTPATVYIILYPHINKVQMKVHYLHSDKNIII